MTLQTEKPVQFTFQFLKQEDYPTTASFSQKVPQMCLVFDSPRRILKMPGFPALMREKAEFIESGPFKRYHVCQLIQAVRKYAQIQQRWGL